MIFESNCVLFFIPMGRQLMRSEHWSEKPEGEGSVPSLPTIEEQHERIHIGIMMLYGCWDSFERIRTTLFYIFGYIGTKNYSIERVFYIQFVLCFSLTSCFVSFRWVVMFCFLSSFCKANRFFTLYFSYMRRSHRGRVRGIANPLIGATRSESSNLSLRAIRLDNCKNLLLIIFSNNRQMKYYENLK